MLRRRASRRGLANFERNDTAEMLRCAKLAERRAKLEPLVAGLRNAWAPPTLKDADLSWVDGLSPAEGADVATTLARRLGSCVAAVDVDERGRFVVHAPCDSFAAAVALSVPGPEGARPVVTCVRADEPGPVSEHTFWRDVSEAVNAAAPGIVAEALKAGGGRATAAGRVALLVAAVAAERDRRAAGAAGRWKAFVAEGGPRAAEVPSHFKDD